MPNSMYARNLTRFCIFSEIKFVEVEDILQDSIYSFHTLIVKHCTNSVRHTTTYQVSTVFQFQCVQDYFW